MKRERKPITELFWSKVVMPSPDECWEWQAMRTRKYGRFNYLGNNRMAHRVAWMLTFGNLPDGIEVLHSCDNPPCVNPAHLFLGTQTINMADRDAKGRVSRTRGLKNGKAKLSDEQVLAIRAESAATALDLAKKYGVSRCHIYTIRAGQRRQHVVSPEVLSIRAE